MDPKLWADARAVRDWTREEIEADVDKASGVYEFIGDERRAWIREIIAERVAIEDAAKVARRERWHGRPPGRRHGDAITASRFDRKHVLRLIKRVLLPKRAA